ncbi:PfkB family carbohydrate kinase [Spelaeicoccus albus]|uniref:Sugar/nucleoside kinase (Ribokinase family) n=1 Tax=Spelaeicoccus albus TaxID=1280376 RepID=A0A7Z0IH07_9MICO|nr:PfkB family carbohydrate kinase [Spelaeicoccus albus]NYI67475.1 sugar/nucleoside kinase (ribokinase family) [Spelaeicoccus albus]
MEHSTPRILGFGDNIVDRFVDRFVEYPGGNCVNVAVLARSLGADCAYMGVIGNDERGRFLSSAIADCGIDTSHVTSRHGPTGLTEIETIDGDRRFLGGNDGGVTVSDAYVLEPVDIEFAAGFDLVHSSVYSQSTNELDKLKATGSLVSYDFSSESEFRTDEYLSVVGPSIDLALLSSADDSGVDPASELPRIAEFGPSLVLATMGASGALLYDGGSVIRVPATKVEGEFVDTMGCGDAYLAAFVVELLRAGWSRKYRPDGTVLRRSMSIAAQAAADQCTVEGAFGYGRAIPADQ